MLQAAAPVREQLLLVLNKTHPLSYGTQRIAESEDKHPAQKNKSRKHSLVSILHKYREMLELPPLLPAVHLSFSAGTSIPVSNSFCHFPSKKAALVSIVPPPYLNMTHMNAGHGNIELLPEV